MKRHLGLLALSASVFHIHAQTVTDPAAPPAQTSLPEVFVTGQTPSPSLTVPTAAEAVEALKLTPGGVGVVDAETYKNGRSANLKDALEYAPGVFVQPRFGAEEARISIRGSGIQRTFHGRGLKLLQDGVPLNLADGGFDMQAVEPLATDYIEVYRGANALRYGSTTLGGAVNFISPTGYNSAPLQARAEYGSFDTIRGQLSSGGVLGSFDYYATATHYSTEGFREHSKQSNQRFFGNFGFKFNEAVETRFYLTYVHTDSELPGSLTKAQLEANPEQAARNPAAPIFDYVASHWKRDFELFRLSNKTTWTHGDGQLTLSSYYSCKDLDHPILFVIDQVSHDFGLDLNYVDQGDLFGRKNRLIAGFMPTFGLVEDVRYANVLGERGAVIGNQQQESMNLDLYFENAHYLTDRLALTLGGQISYANRDNEDRFPVSATNLDNSDRQDYRGYSPKVGLLYDVTPEAQFFLNASRSFEPPSFGELSNPATGGAGLVQLDAQTATTVEIGTRGSAFNQRVAWDIAYYYSWVDDELLSQTVAPGLTQTVNAGRTIHQGVEFGLDVTLLEGIFTRREVAPEVAFAHGKSAKNPKNPAPMPAPEVEQDKLVFRQNYLWSHFNFEGDDEFGDNQLAGIPEHYYRAELLYTHPSGFYAGPNVEWVIASYPVDLANTLDADSYALLGFKIGLRTKKGFSVYVEGKNLTDETYAATTDVINRAGAFNSNAFLPGDGRSFFAGVEYKF